jgi:triosephosphate isomerase
MSARKLLTLSVSSTVALSMPRTLLNWVSEKRERENRLTGMGSMAHPLLSYLLATKPNIDGFLVGGASLKPEDFNTIVQARS